ncbi:hypothetical protein HC231_08120 [Brenneria izadpanahii]|uniref:Uncharacterized protein n=1 Tax=Brenneria izadpanahii TaxID=2722756 RepID=A0ABX7UQI4_9GAMM|nr:hypothetical protein [Brenneria izadpanahii]QTF07901.1 hypothetical protein HC231_08120 [Brenneria izadpanahii]
MEGDGHISTSDGKLHLNTFSAALGTSAPGKDHKSDIDAAVEAQFPQEKKAKKGAASASASASASAAKSAAPAARQQAQSGKKAAPVQTNAAEQNKNRTIDDKVVKFIMESEGAKGKQDNRPEVYGFRRGNGPAYGEILEARNTYGIGSEQEFAVVKKYMNETASKAGALNFTDPGKQAAVMPLAHMRGVGGAQAILNSM